ncbi:MAG: ATP-dependent RNA helicase DbpA [Motiliproteus sp.]
MSQSSFSSLKLNSALVENLSTLGYTDMTPIQAESLPHVLAGRDVIAQAKTGSGKTAAFGLGVLDRLDVKRFRIQTLVLCPTRELADQVAKELRRLGRSIHNIKILTLCGGMPFGPQIGSLEHGAHIIVGTPGRVEEHLRKGTLNLENLTTFVLDEADRMLDMGFQDSLDAIIGHLPKQRQTLLFSATYPDQIQAMADRVLTDPVMVQVASSHDSSSIKQHFYQVSSNEQRTEALLRLLKHHRPESALVFCNTKRETDEVASELRAHDLSAVALHGDLEQRDRDETLVRFSNQSASILVATDVASRGLDIESVDAVINYHLSHDTEVHVHRIGRTGRAGRKGIACTLFSEKELRKIMALEEYLGMDIEAEPLPKDSLLREPGYQPPMATLQIDGGRKDKVRPGDILGALTGEKGVDGKQVGKINIFHNRAYVAVARSVANFALKKLNDGKLKGRSFRVRRIGR